MFIENLDIKLVKEREEIKNFIQNKNDKIKKYTDKVKEIELSYKEKMERFAVVNAEINDIMIPQLFDKLEEWEMPDQVIIKEGKPFLTTIDVRVDAFKQAKEVKENWKKVVEERTKEKGTK